MSEQPNYGKPIHPACDLFPLMDAGAMAGLIADVRANGLVNPIVLHEGQVVDGRNRLLACREANVEPHFVEWRQLYDGPMPLTRWVWSENVERRHLTKEQIAFAIVAMKAIEKKDAAHQRQVEGAKRGGETAGNGRPKTESSLPPVSGGRLSTPADPPSKERATRETRVVLANEAGVSKHLIQRALNVQNAAPELVKAVAQGIISSHEAEKRVRCLAAPAVDATALATEPVTQTVQVVAEVNTSAAIADPNRFTVSQRSIMAAKLMPTIKAYLSEHGERPEILANTPDEDLRGNVRGIAGRLLKVNGATVQQAVTVLRTDPAAAEKVERGETTISAAHRKIHGLAPSKRQEIADKAAKRKMIDVLSHIRGGCRGLSELNLSAVGSACTAEEIKTWAAIARESSKQLRALSSKLLATKGIQQ